MPGAGIAAITGSSPLIGALIGGAAGAVGGAVTSHNDIDLAVSSAADARPCTLSNHADIHSRIIFMRTNLSLAVTLLALLIGAPLLGACHTTAGAGEDLSATGHAITHSATQSTP